MTFTEGQDGHEDDPDALWQNAMADVKPLPQEKHEGAAGKKKLPPKSAPSATKGSSILSAEIILAHSNKHRHQTERRISQETSQQQGKEIDHKLKEKMQKGLLEIEATLDLHGLRQEEAQKRLHAFIRSAYTQQKRCVLVITGKGSEHTEAEADWFEDQPGILRRRFPQWLQDTPIHNMVLQYCPAQQKHGGGGAFYVLLRRHR